MNRIDEALRRASPGAEPVAIDAPTQSQFAPAWSVAAATGAEAGEVDRLTGPGAPGPRGRPTLRFSSLWRERLAMAPDGDPNLIEQFRRLAATLHQERGVRTLRSIMVTSASPGDGKTLTAINFALVLAESYRYKVLLIDADLRRPSIPTVVDIGSGTGLSEALRASNDQKLALVTLTPNLTLLPAGQPVANSIEALTSPRTRLIIEEAMTRFDWVILDAPPVGLTSDARLLTELVDGTLLVIRAGQTQFPAVKKAVEALGGEKTILGVVLNGTEIDPTEAYYTYSAGEASAGEAQ